MKIKTSSIEQLEQNLEQIKQQLAELKRRSDERLTLLENLSVNKLYSN